MNTSEQGKAHKKEESSRKGMKIRYRQGDPLIRTLRNPIETLNWKL